jgi:hypothetical protein
MVGLLGDQFRKTRHATFQSRQQGQELGEFLLCEAALKDVACPFIVGGCIGMESATGRG